MITKQQKRECIKVLFSTLSNVFYGLWGAIYLSYQSKIFNDEPPLTCPYIKQLF